MGILDLLTGNMIQNLTIGSPLVAQWLKLCASSARGVGLILVGQLRFHILHNMANTPPKFHNKLSYF